MFSCSVYHGQDWHPYPVDPYFAASSDHTYLNSMVQSHYYNEKHNLLLEGVIFDRK